MEGLWYGIPLWLHTLNFSLSVCCLVLFGGAGRKILKGLCGRWLRGQRTIHIQHKRCLYELRLWQYRKHLHNQDTQNPVWRREAEHKVPSVAKMLFTIYICTERGNQFSFLLWHCLYQPHSRTSPTPRSNWPAQCSLLFVYHFFVLLCLVFLRERTWIGWIQDWRSVWEEPEEVKHYDQNVWNYQRMN